MGGKREAVVWNRKRRGKRFSEKIGYYHNTLFFFYSNVTPSIKNQEVVEQLRGNV